MVSPWQKKLWVDLAPATLTSISTMALYGYHLPRPWCPDCESEGSGSHSRRRRDILDVNEVLTTVLRA
jgi:hypothetical protein